MPGAITILTYLQLSYLLTQLIYIDIYIDLLSINFNLLSVLQHYAYHKISDFDFTNNNIIGKCIVISSIISVASDNILRICTGTLLTSERCIVLLHTLSAYNSLLVRYKIYSTDPRECFCTSRRYAEAYENFSNDPAPFLKNPMKIKIKLSY